MTLNLNALENLMRFREFTFERADGDEIPVVCSTDVEVARDGYLEVLEHTPAAVNLERAPLPLIDGHRRDSGPFGIVEQLRVAAGKLRGVVRFGNTARAKELLADVKAGILRSVSVAYSIDKYRMEGARLIATRWTPFELSTVTVPADPGAGFYRSAEEVMEIQEERDRAAAIVHAGRMFDTDSRVLDAIKSGESASSFRQKSVLDSATRPAELGMSKTELRRYSLSRALLRLTQPPGRETGFEDEISDELQRRHVDRNGVQLLNSPMGFLIPPDVAADILRRDLNVASSAAGGYLVSTENVPSWVELARARSVALTLGVESLDGLRSSISVPRELAGPAVSWLSTETSQATESTPSTGQVALTPKMAGAYVKVSRPLLLQSSPAVDRFLVRSLLRALGVAIDIAVLNGSGTAGQPLGLLNTAGIGSVTGTSLALAGVLEFQSDVGDALTAGCGYATTRAVAKLLAERQKATGTSTFLWEGNLYDGSLGGYRAMSSGNIPAATLVFGDWPSILLASWGTLAVEINPFAGFQAGIVGARVLHALDVGVLRPSAFAAASSVS